jgi:hypothetical protein
MPRKTQTTILEILLVIGIAILIIVLSIWFYSHSRKTASEEYPYVSVFDNERGTHFPHF